MNPHCKLYPSGLSDAEWLIIKPLLPRSLLFDRNVQLTELENVLHYLDITLSQ
ncbi:hypothetical protein [Nostoc sp.]|uniref:hypothetical protein n=1 Tax=Nostoc sp. TaxID=1180 RepID=UPI002FF4525A